MLLWIEIATWLHTGDASVFPTRLTDLRYYRDFTGYHAEREEVLRNISAQLAPANLLRFAVWLSPALLVMLVLSIRRDIVLPLAVWLCGAAIVLTVVAHQVLMANQMQSWGSRYYNPVLGALVLFALGGYLSWRRTQPQREGLDSRLAVLLLAGLVVFLPWRGLQVHEKVAPRAAFQAAIEESGARIVLLDPTGIWLGFDPLRNDPFLRDGPIMVLDAPFLDLPRGEPGVLRVGVEMAKRYGLAAGTLLEPGE